jgi:hypothetical protein
MREPARLQVTSSQKSWLDRLWRRVNSLRLLPGRGYRLTRTPDGTRLDIDGGKGGGGGGNYHDFILCRNGTQITVSIDSEQDPATTPDPPAE